MNSKLYVGNLSFKATESELTELFSEHGPVVSSRIITDRDSGRSKGFAFVEMETEEGAQTAIEHLDGKEYLARPLKVNVAKPKTDAPRGGGGDRGGQRRFR